MYFAPLSSQSWLRVARLATSVQQEGLDRFSIFSAAQRTMSNIVFCEKLVGATREIKGSPTKHLRRGSHLPRCLVSRPTTHRTLRTTPTRILEFGSSHGRRCGNVCISKLQSDAASKTAPLNAIIIGGSSGMGKAAAIEVVRHGGTALIVSRSQERLQRAKKQINIGAFSQFRRLKSCNPDT